MSHLKHLIKQSFPELQDQRFLLLYLPLGRFWGASLWPLPFLHLIILSPKARRLSDEQFSGLLAHELSHHLIYCKRGWLRYLIITPFIYLAKRKIQLEERLVDTIVMNRGYGRNLYELTKTIDNDPAHDKVKDYYFSPKEIKQYCLDNKLKF